MTVVKTHVGATQNSVTIVEIVSQRYNTLWLCADITWVRDEYM